MVLLIPTVRLERANEKEKNNCFETRPKIPIDSLIKVFGYKQKYWKSTFQDDEENFIKAWRWRETFSNNDKETVYELARYYEGDKEGHKWEKLTNFGTLESAGAEKGVKFGGLPNLPFRGIEIGQVLEQGKNPNLPRRLRTTSWCKITSNILLKSFDQSFLEGFSVKPKRKDWENGRVELVINDPDPDSKTPRLLKSPYGKEVEVKVIVAGEDCGDLIYLYPREIVYTLKGGKDKTKPRVGTLLVNAAWQSISRERKSRSLNRE